MSGVTIYMEGGGRGEGRNALRRGMIAFLARVSDAARDKSLRFSVIPCGSREETYSRFRKDLGTAGPEDVSVLLVDAEGPVAGLPHNHLAQTDGWDLSEARENTIHLMVQVMETWIVADPDALAGYYGQGFNTGKLPTPTELERKPKAQIETGLRDATKHTKKGRYHKINHASDLLGLIDAVRVQERCGHCKQLFQELDRIIAAA